MARPPFIPRGASIGRALKTREQRAEEELTAALAARGFTFAGVDPTDGGVIAVAVNGRHVLMHLGRDKADAMFRLASQAVRP